MKGRSGSLEPLAYKVDEIPEVAGISRRVVFDEMKAGRLRARKLNSATLVLREDLLTFLRGLPDREVAVG